jgi:hypothetical protein
VSTIEELLGRNSSGSGLESREYCLGDPLCRPRDTLYPQRLAVTSPTSVGSSFSIVRSRNMATEFVCLGSLPQQYTDLKHSQSGDVSRFGSWEY